MLSAYRSYLRTDIVFVMRVLGYEDVQIFCNIMDNLYSEIITNIYCTTKAAVGDIVFSEAVVEERRLTANAEETELADLTVSGDRRGFHLYMEL